MRFTRFIRSLMPAAVLGLSALLGGCNILAYPLYVLAPEAPKKTEKADFAGLPNQNIAIVVYADMNMLYEYRYSDIRLELSSAVREQLLKHVKNSRVVDPLRVVRYQDQNLHWDTTPMPQVGRALQADYVLYISLGEFTTREPGSANLAPGRIQAQASLWDVHPPQGQDGCVWRKENLSVVFPPDQPVGVIAQNVTPLRLQTEGLFADLLVKNFYDHKVPQ